MEPISENVCLSGGADGADLQWGCEAGKAGHSVVHWSFKGHKSQAPEQEVAFLTPEQLQVADPHLLKANEVVKRSVPFNKPWIANLLRRNYYQVCDSSSLYGVGVFRDGGIAGGTAWAVAMFADLHPYLPAYFFDQEQEIWLTRKGHAGWEPGSPPRPSGIYAGIGTRALSPVGKMAIRNIFL